MSGKNYNKEGKKGAISASAVTRLVIWSVVFVILLGVFSATMISEGAGFYFGQIIFGDRDYDDEDFLVGSGSTHEKIHELSIEWVSGHVTVEVTDGDKIIISEDYDGAESSQRLRWRVENGELTVVYAKASLRGNSVKAKNLTVAIPESMLKGLEEIHVSAVSASQDIRVSAKELEIDTVSGRVTVLGEYDSVEMDTVSGDLQFDGTADQISIDGTSAKAELHLREQATLVEMNSVSGGLTMILPETTTGFRVDTSRLSGETDVRGFDLDRNDSIWGDGSMKIELNGVSCKLIVEKETNS
jgi:hypothetical protein